MNEEEFQNYVFNARCTALSLLGVLEALRDDKKTVALELLEEQLDNTVLAMGTPAQQVAPLERERIREVLRIIHRYRNAHPRRAECDMANINPATLTSLQRIQDRAQRILSDTEQS